MSTLAILLITVLLVALAYGIFDRVFARRRLPNLAHVVVLGNADQSPRMVEHACALADNCDLGVVLAAYGNPPSRLPENVIFRKLNPFPPLLIKSSSVHYALTILWVTAQLLLFYSDELVPSLILVQNPPGVPLLPLSYLYSKLCGCHIVVDWHNYGSSILALKLSPDNWRVKLYWIIESLFGHLCDVNLCVSGSMAFDLKREVEIESVVFYDRPLVMRPEAIASGLIQCEISGRSLKLPLEENEFLLVSSTSWTVDDRWDILWQALNKLDSCISPRRIVCVITGKGPELSRWQNIFDSNPLSNVRVIPMWLGADMYPRLLSTADLGVCLHSSSSGLDLPMKVLDMLGAGLPVACLDYGRCIREIPRSLELDPESFSLFKDANDLAPLILEYVQDPNRSYVGRTSILNTHIPTWRDEWTIVVQPIIRSLMSKDL